MVQHTEHRQVFHANGRPMLGVSIAPAESRKTSDVIVGVVHLWAWRRGKHGIEVVLQERTLDRPNWPGLLDTTVGGHVDVGESLLEALVRETHEEIGVALDTDRLEFIFGYRHFEQGFKWVYIYELPDDVTFTFNDGEVASMKWVSLDDFRNMTAAPDEHKLRPMPDEYYPQLINSLQRLA